MANKWKHAIKLSAILSLTISLFFSLSPTAPALASVSGRNLPADGKILFFMGQDSTTLSDYKQAVLDTDSTVPKPGGVTLYTNLIAGGNPAPLAGMTGTTANWGAGDVNFDTTLGQFPNAALAVGLYLSDTSAGCGNQPLRAIIGRNDADVTSGNPSLIQQYRSYVDQLINKLKSYDRQVFLRIGYEYDGPWNCYNSDFYKQAFQYIKGRIDTLGANKVATVWQSAAWPLNTNTDHPEYNYMVTAANHFDEWYPGDQYVDWVALSSFYNAGSVGTQWNGTSTDTSPVALQDRVLNFARAHGKPVMIAEAAPQGYQTGAQTKSSIMLNSPQAATGTQIWNEWYAPFFAYIAANSDVIRAVSYINTNWDSQTAWQCQTGASAGGNGCANGYWGDSRVQSNPVIKANFINELKKSIYVNGSGGSTGGGTTDTQAPTAPATLTSTASTSTSVSLSWSASTDNVGVTGYNIYNGTTLAGTTSATTYTVTGLNASTGYTFTVKAKDAAGNLSAASNSVTVTTSAGSGGTTISIPGTVTTSAGTIANGASKSWSLNATAAGHYKFTITSSSSQNSQLITVSFNGTSIQQAIDSGQSIPVYFNGVTAGTKTLTITANSGSVAIGQVTAATN